MGSPYNSDQVQHEQEQQQQQQQSDGDKTSTVPSEPPSRPNPENDAAIRPPIQSPSVEDEDLSPEKVDIFNLKPVSALRLLCRGIDNLVSMTGDVPPTPPIRSRHGSPTRCSITPRDRDRRESAAVCTPKRDGMNLNLVMSGMPVQQSDHIDGVPFKRGSIGSPEAHPHEPVAAESQDIGYNAPPLSVQYGALARKFYSKRPPPISTEDYLLRMHKYCPMSTAVYLATAHYIIRLSIVEKIVPVTPRNVHRLLLAGLRVAMKALEDLSWPHSRFAKVGGVNESELGRLEVTFCFLINFGLKVDAETLQLEAENLCRILRSGNNTLVDGGVGSAIIDSPDDIAARMQLKIPEGKFKHAQTQSGSISMSPSRTPEKRKASSNLPSRPALHVGHTGGVSGGIEVASQS